MLPPTIGSAPRLRLRATMVGSQSGHSVGVAGQVQALGPLQDDLGHLRLLVPPVLGQPPDADQQEEQDADVRG